MSNIAEPIEDAEAYTLDKCNIILGRMAVLLKADTDRNADATALNQLFEEHFQDNEQGRKFKSVCCYGRVSQEEIPLTVFNELCILPRTDFQFSLMEKDTSGRLLIQPEALSTENRHKYTNDLCITAKNLISTILRDVVGNHPSASVIRSYYGSGITTGWVRGILGLTARRERPLALPDLSTLRMRITRVLQLSLLEKGKEPQKQFFSNTNGLLWMQQIDEDFDPTPIYLDACSRFPQYLAERLEVENTTLDKLAGVMPATRYPEVEEMVRQGFLRAEKRFDNSDLLLPDGTLGGTVFALHNGYLSAEWVAAYLVDTDNNIFMDDVRAKLSNGKERKLRICSIHHTFEDPTWVQFGDTKNVYLFLSQRASTAEAGWLNIASYVINLLIDFANQSVETQTHGRYNKKLAYVEYGAGVVNLANPSAGSYGAHADAKWGLVDPTVPGYTRFSLIVPTLSIQNFISHSSSISWWANDDQENKTQASFVQDFVVTHWQLMGVQANYQHGVCSDHSKYSTSSAQITVSFFFGPYPTGHVICERRDRSIKLFKFATCGQDGSKCVIASSLSKQYRRLIPIIVRSYYPETNTSCRFRTEHKGATEEGARHHTKLGCFRADGQPHIVWLL